MKQIYILCKKDFFLSCSKKCLLKSTYKVTLQYFLNVFILFKTVFYTELNFKLKIDPKISTLKTWKKFRKPGIILKIQVANLVC